MYAVYVSGLRFLMYKEILQIQKRDPKWSAERHRPSYVVTVQPY